MKYKIVEISMDNFSEAMQLIDHKLAEYKLNSREIYMAKLLIEENFLTFKRSFNNDQNFVATVSIRKRFGDITLTLEAKGEKYSPIVDLSNISIDDEEHSNLAILKAYQSKLNYSYKNGKNIVSILTHEYENKGLRNTLFGLIFGISLGLLLKASLDVETLEWIEFNILNSIQQIFIDALLLLVAPMIFLSIVSGITDISDAANIKRIGWRIALISMLKLAFYVALGLLVGYLIGGMPQLLSIATEHGDQVSNVPEFSIRQMIINIVPKDVISPFQYNRIIQILFLACFFGLTLSRMGERSAWAREGIELLNSVVMGMTSVISEFIPILVAVSMADLMIHTGIDGLVPYIGLILATSAGLPICFIISALILIIFSRLSPIPFIKKTAKFSALPFSLSSSNACLPETISFCSKDLGINEKIARFSIPIGMQFNMDGVGYYVSVVSMMLVQTFGIEINSNFMISFFTAQVFMAITGIGLLITTSLFASIGIPGTVVTYFIGIEPIMDMFGTAQSVVGNITSSLVVSRFEDEVDEKIYKS